MPSSDKKVDILIVDSGPFIKGAPLQDWSSNVVTIKDVLSEIRDLSTRQRLQVLPYQLTFREPSQSAIKIVTDFSKKTGDYFSLSAIDLRLIALTYQLECENGPLNGKQLRTEPLNKENTSSSSSISSTSCIRTPLPSIAGFYKGTRSKNNSMTSCESNNELEEKMSTLSVSCEREREGGEGDGKGEEDGKGGEGEGEEEVNDEQEIVQVTTKEGDQKEEEEEERNSSSIIIQGDNGVINKELDSVKGSCTWEEEMDDDKRQENDRKEEEEEAGETEEGEEGETEEGEEGETEEGKEGEREGKGEDGQRQEDKGEIEGEEGEREGEEGEMEEESEGEEEGDEEWITPDNLQEVCDKMGGAMESAPVGISVGCMTTDYAMQNVLIQMGLNVISIDGLLIKRLQTFAVQCKACFKTSFKRDIYYCPFCGNKTLIKVLATANGDGSTNYTPLSQKQFSHKGMKYSVPLPKGGRQSNIPQLVPGQKVTFRLPRSRNRPHPLHPDYVAQDSPFRFNDVSSKGAQIGFKTRGGRSLMGGAWHKNPNQVKKRKSNII